MEPLDEYSPEPSAPREPRPGRPLWPYLLAALVVVGGLIVYLLLSRGEPPPPPPPSSPPAAEEPSPPPSRAPVELPPLADSDDWLRRVVAGLSTHPDLASWLVTEDLVRRFTAAVDNVARGESPRPHLGFLAPTEEFAVAESGGSLYVAPQSYERYARVAEVVGSIDAAGAAQLYRNVRPLLEEGYADLGYPDRRFDEALARAVRHLLATPLPERAPRLEAGVESFGFADPQLEGLSAAQKHLLRMGPDNAAVVLAKLREIAVLLDLPIG